MKRTALRLAALATLGLLALAGPARAQNDAMTPIDAPAQPGAITLDTGPLPGPAPPKAGIGNMAANSPAT